MWSVDGLFNALYILETLMKICQHPTVPFYPIGTVWRLYARPEVNVICTSFVLIFMRREGSPNIRHINHPSGLDIKMSPLHIFPRRTNSLWYVAIRRKEGRLWKSGNVAITSQGQRSLLRSMPVAYSDSHPTLYVVHGRAKPVLHGPNSTDSNLFHHGETTYRVGWLSEYATSMLLRIDFWSGKGTNKYSESQL